MSLYEKGKTSQTVKIYFVQDGASCSKEMTDAFALCQEAKFKPKIISKEEAVEINDYEPNVVYVLENFSGDTFDFLSSKECLVVGPACMFSCVTEKIAIPNNGSPVYNTALRGVVVSTTRLPNNEKDEIKKLIGFMGGLYSAVLSLSVTHLIADCVSSVLLGKTGKAIENNIPIITPDWIKISWQMSLKGTKPPDPSNYRLAPFKGMHISCSNLSMAIKKKLQRLIETHGGIYQRTLEQHKTVVLVIGDPDGKKWQYAQQWEIPCVSPTWVYECVERGSLVPSKNHLVLPRPKCSTPTSAADSDSFMSSDISVVPMASERSNVDETNASFGSEVSLRSIRSELKIKPPPRPDYEYKKLLDSLSMAKVREAGLFLDGCKIYLSGFTPLEIEKVKKVINSGGGILFPSISDCLSHIVVGEFSLTDAKELSALNPRPNVVKLDWLMACIQERTTVEVEPYLCLQSAPLPPASPLSDKGLKLLRSQNKPETPNSETNNESKTKVSRKLFVKNSVVKASPGMSALDGNSIDMSALEKKALEEINKQKEAQQIKVTEGENQSNKYQENEKRDKENEDKGNDQRSSGQSRISKETTSQDSLQGSLLEPFFQGICFEISGYDVEDVRELIESFGGTIWTNPGDPKPDYALVPVEGTSLPVTAKNVVSIIFLEDCCDRNCLITDLEYYHLPLPDILFAKKTLEGTVFALSGFSLAEKKLLEFVATSLGATVQTVFSRNEYPEKGVKKSTHLLSKEMSGKKYDAALKWGVPVVTSKWLLEQIVPADVEPTTQPLSPTGPQDSIEQEMDLESEKAHVSNEVENKSTASRPLKRPSPGANHISHEGIEIEKPQKNAAEEDTPVIKRHKPSFTSGNQTKPKSPPTDILKKQLWAKYGGVPVDGVEPGTGKLLKDGPFGEWAGQNSFTNDNSLPRTPDLCARTSSGSSAEATPNRRMWNNFLKSYPDPWTDSTPPESLKPGRQSTPLDVLKKQLWSACGGVTIDGIEPHTGKILKNGPYGQWARDSIGDTSLADKRSEEGDEDVVAEIQRRISQVNEERSAQDQSSADDISPAMMKRLSNRIDISQTQKQVDPGAVWNQRGPSINEENQPVLWDFNPVPPSTARNDTPPDAPGNDTYLPGLGESSKIACTNTITKSSPVKVIEQKIFLLSGLTQIARNKYEGIIQQLGGGLTQTPYYDQNTTHIIIDRPVRSEKLLCCIASGKWVLHTSYLDDCYEARKFLPEEKFEWGNPVSSSRLPKLQPGAVEAKLANAAYKWRKRKEDMGSAAPFRVMKVALFTSENKIPQFTRLLNAGGATILPKSEIDSANYILWDHEKTSLPVKLKDLAQKKVHVVQPVYLSDCLTDDPQPSKYYPTPYLDVWNHFSFKR